MHTHKKLGMAHLVRLPGNKGYLASYYEVRNILCLILSACDTFFRSHSLPSPPPLSPPFLSPHSAFSPSKHPGQMYASGPVYANASGPIGPYISGPIDHSISQGPYATPNPSGLLTPGGRPLAEQQQQQQQHSQQHSGSSRMAPIQQQDSRDEEDEDEDEEEGEGEYDDGHEVITASATSGSDSETYSAHRRRQ